MHAATSGMREHFPDKLHPDRVASLEMAKCAYRAMTGNSKEFQLQDFPGVKTKWRGYDKYDFEFNGRKANIVAPAKPLPGKPWIWRPAFFGAFPAVDIAMLALGYHVVHYDLAFLYGSPRSQELGTLFYNAMIKYYGFSEKLSLKDLVEADSLQSIGQQQIRRKYRVSILMLRCAILRAGPVVKGLTYGRNFCRSGISRKRI